MLLASKLIPLSFSTGSTPSASALFTRGTTQSENSHTAENCVAVSLSTLGTDRQSRAASFGRVAALKRRQPCIHERRERHSRHRSAGHGGARPQCGVVEGCQQLRRVRSTDRLADRQTDR